MEFENWLYDYWYFGGSYIVCWWNWYVKLTSRFPIQNLYNNGFWKMGLSLFVFWRQLYSIFVQLPCQANQPISYPKLIWFCGLCELSCYFVLYYVILHYFALLCIALCKFALLCIIWYCVVLLCITLYYFMLCCIALYYFILLCIMLYCFALLCIIL